MTQQAQIPFLTFNLTAPVNDPAAGAQVSQIEVREIHMRLVNDGTNPNGMVRVFFGAVGDARTFDLVTQLSAQNQTNFTNAVKAAIQTKLGLALT